MSTTALPQESAKTAASSARLVESSLGMFKVICPNCDEVIFETHSRAGAFWNTWKVTDHLAECKKN